MRTGTTRPAAALAAVLAVALAFVLGGCGGDPGPSPNAKPPPPSASPTPPPSSSAPASQTAAPASPPTPGCSAPPTDVLYGTGTATLLVTKGPGTGSYDLRLATTQDNGYKADGKELAATWEDDAGHTLFVDIEGADPCRPDAFVSIAVDPQRTFIDPGHNSCRVELPTLSTDTAAGTFTCTGLGGAGKHVRLDARGTFQLSQ